MTAKTVKINRAPVLTLWAAIVAERLGQPPETALTLGRAVAGLNAQSKARRLGLHVLDQLRALYAFRKAREIFYQRG